VTETAAEGTRSGKQCYLNGAVLLRSDCANLDVQICYILMRVVCGLKYV
jgi:hypothetical protein